MKWIAEKMQCEAGFLHKSVFGKFVGSVGGGLVRGATRFVAASGIPIASQVARGIQGFQQGGINDPRFNRAIGQIQGRQSVGASFAFPQRSGSVLLPQSDPMRKNTSVGINPVGRLTGPTSVAIAAAGDVCPRGFHPNKTDYFLQNGTFVPARSRCVRNRRRNLDNGRASLRAARRLNARAKHNKTIDDALAGLAKPVRRRSAPKSGKGATTVIQN